MVEVRVATPDDAEATAAIYAPIVAETFISFETEPPSPTEMAERIAAKLAGYPWLVAEADGAVLGYVYAAAFRDRAAYRWSVETTAYVAEGARGQGVGAVLYRALAAILRRQGFRSAFAGIALPNPASVALHEKVGFEPIGVYRDVGFKLGSWRDVGWWRLGLCEGDTPPAEPIAFADLQGSPELSALLAPARP